MHLMMKIKMAVDGAGLVEWFRQHGQIQWNRTLEHLQRFDLI